MPRSSLLSGSPRASPPSSRQDWNAPSSDTILAPQPHKPPSAKSRHQASEISTAEIERHNPHGTARHGTARHGTARHGERTQNTSDRSKTALMPPPSSSPTRSRPSETMTSFSIHEIPPCVAPPTQRGSAPGSRRRLQRRPRLQLGRGNQARAPAAGPRCAQEQTRLVARTANCRPVVKSARAGATSPASANEANGPLSAASGPYPRPKPAGSTAAPRSRSGSDRPPPRAAS